MDAFIISCEHGGNQIPPSYRRLFPGQRDLLDSHRGHDPGSLVMATALADAFRAPLAASTTSRLLVDLNRSIAHPQLFSAATRAAPPRPGHRLSRTITSRTACRLSVWSPRRCRTVIARSTFRRTPSPPNLTARSEAPTLACFMTRGGAGRSSFAPAGRSRSRSSSRNCGCGEITPTAARQTG